ncbi:MAG: AMP-binding protein [Sulfitobacter sp.]
MAQAAAFRWDKRAQLFAGERPVKRPTGALPHPLAQIPAHTTFDALCSLGSALLNESGFCVSNQKLPQGTHAHSTHFLTLTGGSSGQPKIIRRTQASWIKSFAVNANQFSLTPDDSVAVFGKLSHSLALYGVLEALYLGLDAYALDTLRPATQCAAVIRHSISILYATPTQLRLLADQKTTSALPSVRLILCGGGHLDQAAKTAVKTLCPNADLHVFYGAAETSFVTLSHAHTPDGSVGSAYPGVTLRILDLNGTPTSDVGEVWIKSPYLFETYVAGQSADTQWRDGFVTVGEMGQIDATGNLWLRGRKTRMVTIADQNVFPEDIETLITSTLHVGACAVIPIPDKTRGNRLIAVLQGELDDEITQAVKELCREKLGALMTPAKVMFHPGLPMLASGKIDLIALSKWAEGQP